MTATSLLDTLGHKPIVPASQQYSMFKINHCHASVKQVFTRIIIYTAAYHIYKGSFSRWLEDMTLSLGVQSGHLFTHMTPWVTWLYDWCCLSFTWKISYMSPDHSRYTIKLLLRVGRDNILEIILPISGQMSGWTGILLSLRLGAVYLLEYEIWKRYWDVGLTLL